VWLVDKSALVRLPYSPDADTWFARIDRGLVRVSSVTALETGFSARSAADWDQLLRHPPFTRLVVETMTPRAEERALEVQRALAEHGYHRATSPADLLVAAVAEVASLVVLHVDKDFDLIASITGQPMERLRLAAIA